MSEIVRFGVSIPQNLLARFDTIIERKGYTNRSEAIRDLIRDFIVRSEWEAEDMEVAGTITIVYDHSEGGVLDSLIELQHSYIGEIISSLHVHMDEHNCLEVIVVRGKSKKVREIAEKLISLRGVKHGKLVTTTTGRSLK